MFILFQKLVIFFQSLQIKLHKLFIKYLDLFRKLQIMLVCLYFFKFWPGAKKGGANVRLKIFLSHFVKEQAYKHNLIFYKRLCYIINTLKSYSCKGKEAKKGQKNGSKKCMLVQNWTSIQQAYKSIICNKITYFIHIIANFIHIITYLTHIITNFFNKINSPKLEYFSKKFQEKRKIPFYVNFCYIITPVTYIITTLIHIIANFIHIIANFIHIITRANVCVPFFYE